MKSTFKRIIVCLLAFAMVFSLAACGSTNLPEFPGLPGMSSVSSSGDNAASSAETLSSGPAASADGYTYVSDYDTINVNTEDYMSVLCYTDSGFYATYDEVVGDATPEGVIPSYEGQYYIREARIVFIGYDGSVTNISSYSPIPVPSATSADQYGYSSANYLQAMAIKDDGHLLVIEDIYAYWCTVDGLSMQDDEYWDNQMYENSYYLRELNADGSEISTVLLPANEDDTFSRIVLDKDGNIILSGSAGLKAVNTAGEEVWSLATDWVDAVACTNDGRIFIATYGDKGEAAYEVDANTHQLLDKSIEIPGDVYRLYTGGGDYPLYYTSGVYFYGMDPDTGATEALFNWIDLDINNDNLGSIAVLSDGSVVGITSQYSSVSQTFNFEKFQISKVPADSVAQKTTLTLATLYLGYEYKNAIIDFNRKSDKYRIEVTDYSEYNTDDDYSAGLTKLTTEIMAGTVPDIIDLSEMPVTQLASKGILEDLYPYIDSDSELDRSNFFENVLAAFEHNGKLVSTVSGFSINTVLGASSLVGEEPGWTYDEFNAALSEMRSNVPDCTPFDEYTTRDTMLTSCLNLDMGNFVNWDTGEVNFDNEQFIALLNFVSQFPESFDWDNYDATADSSAEYRTSTGEQMLVATTLSSFDDIFFTAGYFGGQPYTYIGYPTTEGTGNTVAVTSGFGMTTSCKDKDAAWQFLRTFFTKDYQRDLYSFPVDKELFNEKLAEAMTIDYQKDGNGNYQLDENGEKIPVARLGTYNSAGSITYFYALSQEQADSLVSLVNTTTKTADYNESLNSIVSEQAAAFFAGQKSAEEAAKLVQSKANIYVNEQR